MLINEILAISSLSGARLGISGVVQIVVFGVGMATTIGVVGRHEYNPSGYAVMGIIVISLLSAWMGSAVGQGTASVVWALIFCGAASFLCSGPFLEFRTMHRAIVGSSCWF